MKKLLSICILSVLLTMMSFFTAQAQSSNQCCFWVENMQPETFPHIANLDGTGIAQDTSAGMDLVLNNVLNKAYVGNTDIYRLHFPTAANCGDKVSIEWLLYRDGQLVNGNLSDYADFGIYTRYDQLNADGECQNINWLGGIVENGDGLCGCNPATWHVDHNDFPGARQANPLTPAYFDETHHAAGYTHVLYTYNFDYFYLPFLASEHSTTDIVITWKQVGNYSLVVRIRERLGGTDYNFTSDGSQNPDMNIGGHQSCCGDVLYQDSLHYLVTTSHEKSICEDDPPFPYGRGQVWGPNDSTLYDFYPANGTDDLYYVLFGTYECDHWKVDSIDTFQLYARINPDIVARDTNLCRDENFTANDLLSLVTEVDLDAPGILGHEIQWSENGVTWVTDMSRLTSLNNMTVVAGVYTFYARQYNFYYDALTGDTIGCGGDIDTVNVNVRDLYPPILNGDHIYYFCNEVLSANSPLVVSAHLNNLDECSTEIRWYTEDDMALPTHSSTYFVVSGDTMEVDLTALNPENTDFRITYYLYSYNANTGTYSVGYDSVVIQLYMTPEFIVEDTQLDYVVCPGAEVTMHSRVTSERPEYNGETPTVTYAWYKNGERIMAANDSNFTVNASMVCNEVDTYKVVVAAVSYVGCRNDMSRTFTITAKDSLRPVIAWNPEVATLDSLGNKLQVLSGCDSADVPAPYTVAEFATVGTITDVCSNVDTLLYVDIPQHTTCQTIVKRTYVAQDACGNLSNPIVEIFTLNNDYKPVITGLIDIDPVRPLHNDCKENAPVYDTLLAYFNENITVTYQCPETRTANVVFYLENTNVIADGNLDIFADTDLVTIYAVVTDICGNSSDKTPVFQIHEPLPMYIVHGSITLDTLELCADTNTNMHFNDNYVINAGRPYEYQWSQISVVGQSIIAPDPNNYLEAVVSPVDQMINTSTHFVMTVTDVYGCVASDTANAIHFYRLPDVFISDYPGNDGYPHNDGDTVCPNYGNFYVVANGHSNLPDSIPNYQQLGFYWSGAAISLNPYTDINLFKLACENCDTSYTPVVTVTNKKNCSATASYTIYAYDGEAPVITAEDTVVQPLVPGRLCEIQIPDFVGNNLYFNPSTVYDNCFSVSEMTFTQDVTPGTFVNQNTVVTVHVHTPCGPDADHQIWVMMPDNTIRITEITANPDSACEPLTTTLTPTIINAVGNIDYSWSTGDVTETIGVTATFASHTYTLTVTDASGCANSLTFEPTVYRVPVDSDFVWVKTPNTYCGDQEGDGTVSINVLNRSYSHIVGYLMDGDTYEPYRPLTYTYTDLTEGTYWFTLFTSDSCQARFSTEVISDTTDNHEFEISVLQHNYRCEPPYSGTVAVSQFEGYVYHIVSDTHVTDGETQTGLADVITPLMFNWLYQDNYRVFVTSPKHCHFILGPVTVLNQTDTPSVHNIAIDTVTDCVTPNGVLYIYNTNPTYTYTVNGITKPGNNSTLVYPGLTEGDYMIHIVSSGQCHFYQNFHMYSNTPGPDRPIADLHADNYCYDAGANGSITITSANTHAGYTYTIEGHGTQIAGPGSTIVFDNLPHDTYYLVVVDDHHCPATYPYVILEEPVEVTFAPNEITTVNGNNCTVPNNQIQINAAAGYDYIVTDLATGDTILPTDYNQLADGTYNIHKIHSTYACDHDTNVTVNTVKPPYNYSVNVAPDHDCSVLGTGSIAVSNPNPDYTYTLHTTTPATTIVLIDEDFSNFDEDPYGNTDISSQLNNFMQDAGWTGSKVYESVGSAKLGSSSAIGYVETPELDLSANGGQFVVTFDAKAWSGDNSSMIVEVDGTQHTVTGLTSAEFTTFTLPLTGGTATSKVKFAGTNSNKRFYLDNILITSEEPAVVDLSDNTLVPGTTPFTSLNSGSYVVVATNNTTNCEYLVNATVELDPYYPVISAVSTPNIMCIEPKNGSIIVTMDSVVPATYYVVTSPAPGVMFLDSNVTGAFTQLDSGLYVTFAISNLHCASNPVSIRVVDSAFITPHFTITPNHSCDSTLNMPGTGCIYVDDPHDDAIHNYTYHLTLPGAWMDHDIDRPSYKWCALSENNYLVDIIDNVTGCEWHDTLYVPFEPVHITMTPVITPDHNCVGTGSGTLTVNAVSDNYDSELYFTIDGGATVYPNGATISNLPVGDYEIIVIDSAFLCVFDTLSNRNISIELEKLLMNIDYTVTNNTACDPALYNGAITLNSVKYAVDNTDVNYTAAITGDAWTGLGADNYTITITDNTTGCDTSFVISISTINDCAPTISISSTGHNLHGDYYFCYGEENGKLIATATPNEDCDTTFNYEWTSVCAHASSNTAEVDVYTDETFCCWYYVKATGEQTGCANVDSFYVCVDTLPVIHFLATGPSITLTSGSLTPLAGDPNRPTPNFHNCENQEFTFGIVDPGFDSIIWQNGHVDTNHATFVVPAYSLTPNPDQPTSYCVWVQDHNGCTAGYTAANVYTLPVPKVAVDTASCGTFDYTCQNGIVYHYDFDPAGTNTYTIIDTFMAVNGCDSIVTYTVTVNAVPTMNVTGTLTEYCHGNNVPVTMTAEYANSFGMKLSDSNVEADFDITHDEAFDYTAPVERRMNHKYVYAFAENSCDTIYQLVGQLFVDSLPVVTVSGTPEFCAGSEITPTLTGTVVAWNNEALTTPQNTYWRINETQQIVMTIQSAHNGQHIVFAARNHCGTTYSDPLQLTVHTVEAPTLALAVPSATFCAGEPIELADITITHNTTATALDTTYTLGGAAYTLGTPLAYTDNGKELVASVTYDCGSAIASNPVSILVNDTANLVVPTTNDTLCIADGAYTFTVNMNEGNTLTATVNNTNATVDVTLNSGSSADITVTPVSVGNITVTITSTAAGNCGVKTADIHFFVGQKPIVATPADVVACAGDFITPAVPTITANGIIRSQGWMIDGSPVDLTTTRMTTAMNGKDLTYYVENFCGVTESAPATLTVKDTASLEFSSSIATDDTVCVGSDIQVNTILVHPTNTLTWSVNPDGALSFSLDGDPYTAPGAALVMTGVSAADVTVTITSSDDCGDPKTLTLSFVVSEPVEIDAIAAPAAVCEGEVLALTAPTITDNGNSNIHAQGWEIKMSGDADYAAFDPTTPMTADHNGASLRYMVENVCATVYSNVVSVTVNDTAKLTAPAEATQTVCNNKPIADIVMTTNKPLELSSELTAAGLSVSGNTISGTVSIPATETFPYTLTGTVSTVSTDCPAYDKTETITITVTEVPVVTLTAPDVVCDGNDITSTFSVVDNGATITAYGYEISQSTSMLGIYNEWIAAPTAYVADHDHYIYYSATNNCGTSTSDTFQLRVAGHATVVIDPSMFRDTCANNPFSDFLIGEPTVTLATDATVAVDTLWLKKDGANYTAIEPTTAIADPTSVVCVVVTECFRDTSNVVDLTFDKAPAFANANPFTTAQFTVCEGTPFTDPGLTVGDDNSYDIIANTDGEVRLTWTIDGVEMDFTTAYDHASFDGKDVKLTVCNDCDCIEYSVPAVIRELPVPEMLKDTTVCADPANEFTLSVANENATSTYEWFGSDNVSVATTPSVTLPAGIVDTVMTFYVVETDENGCVSQNRINVSPDTISSDVITVKVTTKPAFIFTDMAGTVTHDINSSINNKTTAYKWTVDTKCYTDMDTKVFVNFYIYYNGELIPATEISNYITKPDTTINGVNHEYNTYQYASFTSGDGTSTRTDYAFYTTMANHYPHSNLGGASYDFDWLYLHFVASRFFTNTVAQFLQTGDYEIHYELYATDGSEINYYYKDGGMTTAQKIGGHNYTGATLLTSDVFTIHVDDGPAYENNEAPEAPAAQTVADEPTVKLYPNPTTENVNVRIEGFSGHTMIRISTLTGKTIAERAIEVSSDSKFALETFNVADLTPGVYVMQIVNDEAIISRKLVITK